MSESGNSSKSISEEMKKEMRKRKDFANNPLLEIVFSLIQFVGAYISGSVILFAGAFPIFIINFNRFISQKILNSSKATKETELYLYIFKWITLTTGTVILILSSTVDLLGQNILNYNHNLTSLFAVLGILYNIYREYSKGETGINLLKATLSSSWFWVTALITGLIPYLYSNFSFDPIFTIVISGYILLTVVQEIPEKITNTLDNLAGELEKDYSPDIDLEKIKPKIKALDQVIDVKDLSAWLDEKHELIFTCHVVIKDTSSQESIYVTKVKTKSILKQHGAKNSVVETVYKSEQAI
jgi:Co/Zn/Cd efflux system component